MTVCPLCISHDCTLLPDGSSRPFILCNSCGLVFVPRENHLTPEEEKQRYALHHNSPDDRKYHDYLSSIADDVLRLVKGPCAVLDFGSGKNQVLATIMRARGAHAVAHDPLYGMSAGEDMRFNVVVACEALEHLRDPRRDIDYIARVVMPAGYVYARTRLYDGVPDLSADFDAWWYAKDPTHICFFCGKTMEKVAEIVGKEIIETNGKDTVVFGPLAP